MTTVDVRDMDRAELEKALLLSMGLNRRLLKAIRDNAKPEWKITKECEELAEKYQGTLSRQFVRGADASAEKKRVDRTADRMDREVWGGFMSEEGSVPQRGPRGVGGDRQGARLGEDQDGA